MIRLLGKKNHSVEDLSDARRGFGRFSLLFLQIESYGTI